MPTTIDSNLKFVDGFLGPFLNGSDLYVFGQGGVSTDLEAWKSTDGGSNWTEQDTANRPGTADLRSLNCDQRGTVILCLTGNQATADEYRSADFDMSDDTWGSLLAVDDATLIQCINGGGIAARSDGSVIALYNGQGDNFMGTAYQRVHYAIRDKTSGTWDTVEVQVDSAGAGSEANHWVAGCTVLGSSDRVHFFFANNTLADAFQRTLTSSDVLETFPSAFDTGAHAPTDPVLERIFCPPGINYDDGGTARIRAAYLDADEKISIVECASADAPTMSVTTGASDTTVSIGTPIAESVQLTKWIS